MISPAGSLRRGQPIWLPVGARPRQRYPSLRGHHEADLAIVGGGMTGALVAREFSAAGASVCLVEAALIGRGSTAASSALLLQEPDQGGNPYSAVLRLPRQPREIAAAGARFEIGALHPHLDL